jgi:hypothetical protein
VEEPGNSMAFHLVACLMFDPLGATFVDTLVSAVGPTVGNLDSHVLLQWSLLRWM